MVIGNLCVLLNVHNTNANLISLQLWRCNYMAPKPCTFAYFNTLHFTFSVRGEEVPCNLTQVVFDTPRSTSTSGENNYNMHLRS
jgi:hypothetical protein